MAKVREEYTFTHGAQGKRKYPWNEWFDGQIWELLAGVDYTCSSSSMVSAIYKAAGERAGKCRVRRLHDQYGDSVVLQFYRKEGE